MPKKRQSLDVMAKELRDPNKRMAAAKRLMSMCDAALARLDAEDGIDAMASNSIDELRSRSGDAPADAMRDLIVRGYVTVSRKDGEYVYAMTDLGRQQCQSLSTEDKR